MVIVKTNTNIKIKTRRDNKNVYIKNQRRSITTGC